MARDNFLQKNWRPAAFVVYSLICLTDFIVMPFYYEYSNQRIDTAKIVEMSYKFQNGPAQIEALKILKEQRAWKPLTTDANGWIHISFMAILGAAAVTRGQEKIARIKNGQTDQTGTGSGKADNPDEQG